jgi:formamidopyrimidine-DNA glycosylase
MPELPEVEVVRKSLEENFRHQPQIAVITLNRSNLRFPMPKNLNEKLQGAQFLGVERRAKYLLIKTSRGTLLSHLGMTGSWRLVTQQESLPQDIHQHVEIEFSDGSTLVYRDPRRFGVLDFIKTGYEFEHKLLKHLGLEPFAPEFTADFLFARSRKRKAAVKVFIMDQKIVVGVGNIYASEALFAAGIKPTRAAGRVTHAEFQKLVVAIQKILQAAIAAGGSSIQDFRSTSGASGYFQQAHQVYDRGGEACLICQKPLKSKVLGGRSTYWCRVCQR